MLPLASANSSHSLHSHPKIKANYRSTSYNVSKITEIYTVRALAERLPLSKSNVVINVVNPGLCDTELIRNLGLFLNTLIKILRLLFARTAEEGSRNLLYAAVAGEESHGKYLSDCEIKE